MKYRKPGDTGMELSVVGYRCKALFGKDITGKTGMEKEAEDTWSKMLKHQIW